MFFKQKLTNSQQYAQQYAQVKQSCIEEIKRQEEQHNREELYKTIGKLPALTPQTVGNGTMIGGNCGWPVDTNPGPDYTTPWHQLQPATYIPYQQTITTVQDPGLIQELEDAKKELSEVQSDLNYYRSQLALAMESIAVLEQTNKELEADLEDAVADNMRLQPELAQAV